MLSREASSQGKACKGARVKRTEAEGQSERGVNRRQGYITLMGAHFGKGLF